MATNEPLYNLYFNLGASSALFKLGVYDLATWVAGLSGGSWHVSSWYKSMLDKTEMVDPRVTHELLKNVLLRSTYPDAFNANYVSVCMQAQGP